MGFANAFEFTGTNMHKSVLWYLPRVFVGSEYNGIIYTNRYDYIYTMNIERET